MSTNFEHNGEDEREAARRTAHALGQTSRDERRAVEREMAASPQVRQEVESAAAVAARLKDAAQAGPPVEPSSALRTAVENRLNELESAAQSSPLPRLARRWRRRRLIALAMTAACLLAVAVPLVPWTNFFGRGAPREVAKSSSAPTAAARALSSRSVDGVFAGRGDKDNPVADGDQTQRERQALLGSMARDEKKVTTIFDRDDALRAEGRRGLEEKLSNRHEQSQGEQKPAQTLAAGDAYAGSTKISAGALQVLSGQVVVGRITVPSLSGAGTMSISRLQMDVEPRETQNGRLMFGVGVKSDAGITGNITIDEKNARPAGSSTRSGGEREQPAIQHIIAANSTSGFNFNDTSSPLESGEQQAKAVKVESLEGMDVEVLRGTPQDAREVKKSIEEKAGTKPLETWKPARAVPNASRLMVGEHEELPLKGMQVDVRIDGFRARVLLDLYYLNDRPQQLEGNFQLRLPDEAAPYFFAFGKTVYQAPQVAPSESMFFKPQQVFLGDTTPEKIMALRGNSWEQPKVARMVPKEKAAVAYRDTVRRRIDPALVEWSGAGVFQCRVFPLTPQSLHRVTIGYDVDLVRVGDDLELRLDLPEQPAPATVVDLNVAAADARQVSLDAPATPSTDGRLTYRLADPKERPLVVRLRKPGTQMLSGSDEAANDYFATRVTLPLPETAAAERPKKAIFLVDASLGAGPQFPLWTKMLRATLQNNRDQIKEFAVLFFNVETFWWQEKYMPNTPENVDAAINYADSLALEGATDLGRALQEAAEPRWGKEETKASPPDMFLLSDGAATWGEDRWGLLAAILTGKSKTGQTALTPGPSPNGRGEACSALFAYRTGLPGGDSRLLAYLAERTGGAVFSLVGEAEIAAASVAHRNRPWQLTSVEMAGAHDLLVAGRPQYVFPGQQLTVVGRLEGRVAPSTAQTHHEVSEDHADGGSGKLDPPYLAFTLRQGKSVQTVKVAMDRVLTSELAARTYGQVATNQLEDVCGVAEAAEPVATAYARHFRITGRTCSLLMLESEQDYARFNIKPEEDSFVVQQRPADALVAKAVDDAITAMSGPKATFLAWYNRLSAAEVRFDLPGALKVFLDGLPEETFAVAPPPLACKQRLRQDLPENLRQPWQTGLPEYETVDAEAQRRLAACGPDDALRCLSSLVEQRPGDAALSRDLAFTAIDWQRPGEAYHLLRRASAARTFEPITFHAMAHCLEQMGRADLAIIYYELACGGQWDARFGDMHNIALLDYARFLRRVVAGKGNESLLSYASSRLNALAAMNLRDTADVAALIFWNTDGTDVDLHVLEPGGEECFYSHPQTASGGHLSRDVTTGYGPELYLLPKAPSGRYEISAHYFAADANRASTRTKVLAFVYENWGEKDERVTTKSLALTGRSEKHPLGVVKR